MNKFIVLFLLGLIGSSMLNAQEVKWYSWEEGYEKAKKEDKTMLVFIHAEWCNMCKRMLDKTFTKEATISLINKDFVAVKYDVDKKATYVFDGREYQGNQLAGALIKSEQLGIPTTAFVYTKTSISIAEAGLKNHEEMQTLLGKYK